MKPGISKSSELDIKRLILRIIVAFALGVSAVLVAAFYSNLRVQSHADASRSLDEVIEASEKQRTLSQFLSKNVLLLNDSVGREQSIASMDSALSRFQFNHSLIEAVNDTLRAYKDMDLSRVEHVYNQVTPLLNALVKSSYGIQEASNAEVFREAILEHEKTYLPLMDELITIYQQSSDQVNARLRQSIIIQYWGIGGTVVLAALAVLIFTLQLVKAKINAHKLFFSEIFDSKHKFERFVNGTHDVVYELDGHGKYLFVNPAFKEVTGIENLDEINKKRWIEYVHKDHRKEVRDFFIETQKKREDSCYFEFPIVARTGDVKWMGQTTDFTYDRAGRVVRIYNVAKDITEKRASEAIESKYKMGLRLLNELASKQDMSIQERLEDGLKVCLDFLGLKTGIVSEIWMDEYRISAFYPPDANLNTSEKYQLGNTYCDITLNQKGKVIGLHEMESSDFNSHPCFEKHQLQTYIGAAYRVNGKVSGTVNFTSKEPRSTPFSEYEIDFISLVGRWVGTLMEYRENQNKMLEEQDLLKTFVSSAPAAIAMFDKHMTYISASKRWYEDRNITGDIIGKSHYKVFPDIPREWKAMHQRALSGEIVKPGLERFEGPDGTERWVQGEIHPWYTSKDKVGGIIIFTNDLTGMKLQEVELREAKEHAEAAGKIKEQFLSTMSHEIRTPLNAIIGTTHLLEMDHPELSGNKRLNMLKFGSNNLLALINDILDVQKIESGNLEIVNRAADLKELVSNIIETWKAVPQAKNIEVSFDYDTALSSYFTCDETRLTQILNNLISNSLKFTEKGKVELSVYPASPGNVGFKVVDSGIGIPEDKLETIFESFKQINNEQTLKAGGTGLGLSICKRLVEMMDGTLQVASEEGVGTTFHFEIPLAAASEDAIATKTSQLNTGEKLDLHVLLVEDNLANQEIAKGFLERWGIRVTVANNGKEAVEMVESKAFDLMLIDVRMPVMDGYEATAKIRSMEDEYFKQLPIIALTASTLSESKSKMEKSGMNEFVSKPFDPEDLYEKVCRLGKAESSIPRTLPKKTTQNQPVFSFLNDVLGGDQEQVMMIASMTVESIGNDLKASRSLIKSQDREETHNHLHKMKSHLANLGLRELVDMMPHYQADDFFDHLPEFLSQVEEEMKKVKELLV